MHVLIIKSGYGNFFQTLLLKSLLIHKMYIKYIIQLYLLLFCWLHIPELGCMIILFISGQYLVLRVSLTDCRFTFEPHHGRICDTAKESRLWSLKFSVKYCLEHEHLLRNLCLVTFIYVNLLIKKINKNMNLKKGIFFFKHCKGYTWIF